MNERVLEVADKIQGMKIRGAGRIARAAAQAMIYEAESFSGKTGEEFVDDIKRTAKFLVKTRPSAVSLPNALRFILSRTFKDSGEDLEVLRKNLIFNAKKFIKNSQEAVERIGEIGSHRIKDGDIIMTHCQSNAAFSVMKTANDEGKKIEVFVRETRPRFQGRLTAKLLRDHGISVTLIVDSAARYFIDDVDHVIVGADSVASNGAVVNKIGTSELAVLAHEARVRMMVATETYKFHPGTMFGELVEIEERDVTEVISQDLIKEFEGIKIKNPAFDITPPEYIDIIVTEKGVIPPQAALMVLIEQYGWRVSEKEIWE